MTGFIDGAIAGSLIQSFHIGEVAPEMRAQIQGLPLAPLESLGEALLDFTGADDLSEWMQRNS